jgi:hypothetical protein
MNHPNQSPSHPKNKNKNSVLSRLRAVRASPKHAPFVKFAWRTAEALVDDDDPGAFNQALMELGGWVGRLFVVAWCCWLCGCLLGTNQLTN